MARPLGIKSVLRALLNDYDGEDGYLCTDLGMAHHRLSRLIHQPEAISEREEIAMRTLHHERLGLDPEPAEEEAEPCP